MRNGERKKTPAPGRTGESRVLRAAGPHLSVLGLALLFCMVPTALNTPGHSDESALAVVFLWLGMALGLRRLWRLPARRPGRVGRVLWAVVCMALGLGLYRLALGVGSAAEQVVPARADVALRRPGVLVATPENPWVLARVVEVREDLSLAVDPGRGPCFEVVHLAGVNAFEWEDTAVEAAARGLKEILLGRLVALRVIGPLRDDLEIRAEQGWPARVEVEVFSGDEAYAGRPVGRPVNETAAVLLRLASGGSAAPGGPGSAGAGAGRTADDGVGGESPGEVEEVGESGAQAGEEGRHRTGTERAGPPS